MISAARRLIGSISVREANGFIYCQGLPANVITSDIARQWSTGRVNSYMFTRLTRSEIVIPSFFAVEFLHILTVLSTARKVRTNKRALQRLILELTENTWLRQIDAEHPDVLDFDQLKQIRFKLLPHQLDFIERYNWVKPRYNLRGLLLMVPPGGGKTISDIAIAVCCKADYVYVVSPKNAIYNVWQKTLLNDMAVPQTLWIADQGIAYSGQKWRIFHYETLSQAIEMAKKESNGKRIAIILDESHNFNDSVSLRTESFVTLCAVTKSQDIIWASGTPIKAMGKEAIPLIRTIDPLFNDDVENRFKRIFGQSAEKGYDILAHRLGLISFKVPKSDFMAEEPTVTDIKVTIPNGQYYTLANLKTVMQNFIAERRKYYAARSEEDHKFYASCINSYYVPKPRTPEETREFVRYQSIVRMFIKNGFDSRTQGEQAKFCNIFERDCIIPTLPKDLKNQFIDVKSVVKYVDLKIRGECLGRVLSKERENCHVDMLKSIDFEGLIDGAEKKTLVFTSYVNVVNAAFDILANTGYAPLRVYGDTNSQLTDIIGQYERNPDINPLIATYQSLSSAVPLTMANNLILLNSPFRHHEQEQAISRCNRLGQDKPVTVWRVFLDTGAEPNISTRSEEILDWSRVEVSRIMGIDNSAVVDIALEDVFGAMDEDDEYGDVSLCLEAQEIIPNKPPSLDW